MLESVSRLTRPGEAAFIVAAPIVQDPALASFRENLIDYASEVECYELPHKTFNKRTEVQSFLLIARFGAKGGHEWSLAAWQGPSFRSLRPDS
jgi:hypothetical protein